MTTAAKRRAALDAFDRAVGREMHNLARSPALLWQQLYNRLQWQARAAGLVHAERTRALHRLLEAELAWTARMGAAPWLKTTSPFREAQSLVGSLVGHTDWVNACAISPDGSFVISAGNDGVLKLWEPIGGVELLTFDGHQGWINDCAWAPDGSFVISAASDGLKAWANGQRKGALLRAGRR